MYILQCNFHLFRTQVLSSLRTDVFLKGCHFSTFFYCGLKYLFDFFDFFLIGFCFLIPLYNYEGFSKVFSKASKSALQFSVTNQCRKIISRHSPYKCRFILGGRLTVVILLADLKTTLVPNIIRPWQTQSHVKQVLNTATRVK